MYLKGMVIQGFKSFADKISLEFTDGITSVIGPNGSGKSNIADAVRWVLGEQSAKTLRGGKMEDIIFSGTEHRKAMGFSEVSLSLDNSDMTLAVDFAEVTVTRRLYRSGESEYLINKTACRLKDINELFMDTGLGRDGYSIIGQGRVDEILSTKSEDRRHIFEEASGITKFKVRKVEAEKKLELTKQNIYRINDIISELENQIEPLREQSEKARKFILLRDELKEIEVNVFIENIAIFKEKAKEFEEKYILIKQETDEECLKLECINEANKSKNEALRKFESSHDEARKAFYENEAEIEKNSSQISFNNQRTEMLKESLEKLDTEADQLDNKIEAIKTERMAKEKRVGYLVKQQQEFTQKLEVYEKQLADLMKELGESERQIELYKADIMDKLDILSDKKAQINNQKHHMDSIKLRCNSIENELYHLRLDKDKENIKKEDYQINHRNIMGNLNLTKEREQKLQNEKKELLTSKAQLQQKSNDFKSKIQMATSKHRVFEDMERNLEGYSRSVKELLNACKNSPTLGKGIYGALAQLISVDKKHETAIEIALGGSLQNIVTQTEEDAKRAIEYLKSTHSGRATFLPISSVSGKRLDDNTLNILKGISGFCGVASELIKCDNKYSNIIQSLLGRVVVVDHLDNGIQMARRFNYSFRIVSLQGDILNTGGSMSGGSNDQRQGGILSRHREIAALKVELEVLKLDDQKIMSDIASLEEMQKEVEQELISEYDRIRELELEKIKEEGKLKQIDEDIKRIEARSQLLIDEKAQNERSISNETVALEKLFAEQKSLDDSISLAKDAVSKFQEKSKESQLERDNLHLDITDYRVSVNSIKESLLQANELVLKLIKDEEDLQSSTESRDKEKERYKNELCKLVDNNLNLDAMHKRLEGERVEFSRRIEEISLERKLLEEELDVSVKQVADINQRISLLKEELSRIEVRSAKFESELEIIQNRLWEEYELTFTNALVYKKDILNITSAQKKINELKNEIRNLGSVNAGAIEEYVKVKERFEFMSLQRDDMLQADEKLQKVILEITNQMKHQFVEQFRLINANFGIVFKELFDGGRAELILVDEQNVLESGIEIEVQPPGKKLQNMMLLSGGERAFTAIALLFAILKLRPTPFCILDEIEAALDDANVHRFAQYLKRFSEDTQFVVVTHRKGTMEASDCLYGVTMQEHGISRVVSLKLNEAS